MPTFQVLMDPVDVEKFTIWMVGMGKRAARAEILPILLTHLQPLVASEKGFLSGHEISGALSGSLMARSGRGDREGTISVFSAPMATTKLLQSTWGSGRGRKQQQRWAAGIKGKKGRSRVFYGIFVHQGHDVISHGKAATSGKTHTDPIPFAQQAADSLGDSEVEAAATEILQHIIGG
jgi:hypothetical protein